MSPQCCRDDCWHPLPQLTRPVRTPSRGRRRLPPQLQLRGGGSSRKRQGRGVSSVQWPRGGGRRKEEGVVRSEEGGGRREVGGGRRDEGGGRREEGGGMNIESTDRSEVQFANLCFLK